MIIDAFLPTNLGSVTIPVGAAASSTLIPRGAIPTTDLRKGGGEYLYLQNTAAPGGAVIFVEFSQAGSTVATVANSFPIQAGQGIIVRRGMGDDTISAIASAAGPTNLIVSVGVGT